MRKFDITSNDKDNKSYNEDSNELIKKISGDILYIDPPYNTGKADEFMYNDKYVDINDGYRHSKWLSFMNKRLLLAKNLLTDNGVIFLAIDYNEIAQLKLLCNQVFGEENFIAQFIRKNKARYCCKR